MDKYAHLIARRIRELGVYAKIVDPLADLKEYAGCRGIILSGGPASVYDANAPKYTERLFTLGIPILGICYGHQLIAYRLGGKVERNLRAREYGRAIATVLDRTCVLFQDVPKRSTVWTSHGDSITAPPGFSTVVETRSSEGDVICAGIADTERQIFGVQFHPEVTHTKHGKQILYNFLQICEAKRQWSIEKFLEAKEQEILTFVGDRRVIMFLSGGVDSLVTCVWLSRILNPNQIRGLFIVTGLHQADDVRAISAIREQYPDMEIEECDYSDRFLERLADIVDPEEKRTIIGTTFAEIFEEIARDLAADTILAQGTIYPDTIETGRTKHARVIKTHHNRVPAILKLAKEGRLLEPIDQLYKDEVRALGKKLGIPHDFLWRHPFPGPGLAIRVICAKEVVYPPNLPELTQRLRQLVAEANLLPVVLPIRSVGVQGDERTYAFPVMLIGRAPWHVLERISTKITNNCPEINRVLWVVSPLLNLPPEESAIMDVVRQGIGVFNARLTKERIAQARWADQTVLDRLRHAGLYHKIWQCPVVLLPLGAPPQGSLLEEFQYEPEMVVIGGVLSDDGMTAQFAKIPKPVLHRIAHQLMWSGTIRFVLYDITNKPPRTIEWE